MKDNILVIKHGAFGDIILAGAAMEAIRNHHKDDCIICITTEKFEKLLKFSPWFNFVFVDPKPKWNNFKDWNLLRIFFNKYKFKKIYDLQTSNRSNLYFFLFFLHKKSDWSGIALGCKYRHNNIKRKIMHTIERQKDQLKIAGIEYNYYPDWSWLLENYQNKSILPKNKFAILVTGAAIHRKSKRWSQKNYAKLIFLLSQIGIQSVLLGGKEEIKNIDNIIKLSDNSLKIKPINYAGKTEFKDIVFLSSKSEYAIGNDTGPMHLIASCGCKTIVLFGSASNPDLCAPKGKNVSILRNKMIDYIEVDKVMRLL